MRQTRLGRREVRRRRDGLPEQALRLGIVFLTEAIEMPEPPLVALPDIQAFRWQSLRALALAMSLSLLKFAGQASLVDEAMLPS